jgi:hypothetical protein
VGRVVSTWPVAIRMTCLSHISLLSIAATAAFGLLLSGCKADNSAGGNGGSIVVTGTLDGGLLPAFIDVGGLAGSGGTTSGPLAYVEVYATNKVGACGWLDGQNIERASLTTLQILITNSGSGGDAGVAEPVAPGTYSVGFDADGGFSQQVQAGLLVSDATCQSEGTESANTGTITLTSITPTSIVGSFDLMFYSGDELMGSFTAPVCTSAIPGAPDAAPDAVAPAPTADAGACHP